MKKILLIIFAAVLTLSTTAQSYKGSTYHKTVEEKLNEDYCTGLFKSTHGTIFDMSAANNTFGFLNILDWLEGRVAGLQVYKSRTGVSIPVIRGTVAGVYVDEIPVSFSYLNAISNADIAMIKIIKSPFMGGFNGAGGAIAIYTINVEEDEDDSK
jgi:TonB-dependent Receptor Plug Domain